MNKTRRKTKSLNPKQTTDKTSSIISSNGNW